MAYPLVVYGPEGEQFNNYSAARWPLGTRMSLQDGRRFAFCKAGSGAALATGKIQQSEVPDGDHDTLAVVSGAVNARTIVLTNGSGAIAEDLYADGIAITEAAAGASEGYLLKVDLSHDALGASTSVTLPLAAGYGLPIALNTSDTITLMKNPYDDVIISAAPPVALILGVATSPVPLSNWGWLQTWGPAAVLVDNTQVIGASVSPDGTAGTSVVGAMEATGRLITTTAMTTAQCTEILRAGVCMELAPTTGYGAIFLTIS